MDFTENDQIKAIKGLQTNYSAGPDGIPGILLNKVGENLSKTLSIMRRESLRTGLIPNPLKVRSICPIHKGGLTFFTFQVVKNLKTTVQSPSRHL